VNDDLRLGFDLRFARIIFTACMSKRAVANVAKSGGVCGERLNWLKCACRFSTVSGESESVHENER
jgi:hypothetical protein